MAHAQKKQAPSLDELAARAKRDLFNLKVKSIGRRFDGPILSRSLRNAVRRNDEFQELVKARRDAERTAVTQEIGAIVSRSDTLEKVYTTRRGGPVGARLGEFISFIETVSSAIQSASGGLSASDKSILQALDGARTEFNTALESLHDRRGSMSYAMRGVDMLKEAFHRSATESLN